MKITDWRIVNVIATTNVGFMVDIQKLYKDKKIEVVDSNEKYLQLVNIPNLKGYHTVFYNGNINSIGNKSIREAKQNCKTIIEYLKRYKMK